MALQPSSYLSLRSLSLSLGIFAIVSGCANSNTPSVAAPIARGDDELRAEQPLEPASAPLAARGTPSTVASTGEDLALAGKSAATVPEPACSMYAETIPHGIALIFEAGTSSADQVAVQVEALAREINAFRGDRADTAQPSSFSTRQIAELSVSSTVTRTDRGARLSISAKDPEPQPLRSRVLWQMASFLPDSRDTSGLCPIVPRQVAEQREQTLKKADEVQRSGE